MEHEKTKDKKVSGKKPEKTLKKQIAELENSMETISSEFETIKLNIQKQIAPLTNSVETISSELETIKLNIQKRKSENTTLKILLYTGLIVLLLGFLYTNSTLQRAQMDSLESSIISLQTLMNQELMSVEKIINGQIDRLEKSTGERSKNNVQERLENMTLALSQLKPTDEKTLKLIDQVKKEALELGREYAEYKKSLEGKQVDSEGSDPGQTE